MGDSCVTYRRTAEEGTNEVTDLINSDIINKLESFAIDNERMNRQERLEIQMVKC